jgi:hypothetical protein
MQIMILSKARRAQPYRPATLRYNIGLTERTTAHRLQEPE